MFFFDVRVEMSIAETLLAKKKYYLLQFNVKNKFVKKKNVAHVLSCVEELLFKQILCNRRISESVI